MKERGADLLSTVVERVPDCAAAAWVDARTGAVIAQHAVYNDLAVGLALDGAIEVMRSRERPQRMVLLSARHVHVIHRAPHDMQRVLVVICARSSNLGLAVSIVRMLLEGAVA